MIVSFLMIPVSLDYLNPTKFGVWLTLYSIVGWLSFFDVGLGNGLRNKLAKAIAEDNIELGRSYISTTYALLFIICLSAFGFFLIINNYLNWSIILNASDQLAPELNLLALVVVAFFLLKLALKLVGIIYIADQMPSVNNGFEFLGNLIAFFGVLAISQFSHGSLLYLGIVISLAPIPILILASFYTFVKVYRKFLPSFRWINFKYAKELSSLGGKFFVLQIASVILITTDNIIITQIIGPEAVTNYNIVYKYFSLMIIGFSIVVNTYWSAITEAYHNEDYNWIRNIMEKLNKLWIGFVLGLIIMIFLSHTVIRIWVGEKLSISNDLIISIALFVAIHTLSSIYVNFVNGIGKLKVQTVFSTIAILLNIPLSIYFARDLSYGTTGVVMSTIAVIGMGCILMIVQYKKIMAGNAKGIWNE